jgi:hypothetical protein
MALGGIDWTRPNVDAERMAEHAREAREFLKALERDLLWLESTGDSQRGRESDLSC